MIPVTVALAVRVVLVHQQAARPAHQLHGAHGGGQDALPGLFVQDDAPRRRALRRDSLGPTVIVRTWTILSAFLPAIFAQSSGLVVFGRSSCSLNSSRMARMRSSLLMPRSPVASRRLIAYFLARETIPSIRAPLEKSFI